MQVDAYAPEFIADPYPTYARMRAEAPVFYDDTWNLTFFSRHADVTAILKDRERFGRDFRHRMAPSDVNTDLYRRIYPPQYPTWTRYVRESFIDLEPPRHTRLRRLVSQAFTRRRSEEFRPRLAARAARLLDRALDRGRMEAIADYATPIPLEMIADLMGIPDLDRDRLLGWSHAMVTVFDENVSPAAGEAAEAATKDFIGYLEPLVAERRRRPGTDLISTLTQVEEDGDRLTTEEIVGTSILTLNAGHEATVHAIGNALLALANHPDEYRWLGDNPELIGSAVDELLRYDTPLQMFERWVLQDVDWNGVSLAAGTKVGLLFGSANHDEDVFSPDPEVLDLRRDSRQHVAFGAGLHLCVGAPLARVELEVALGELARRAAVIEVEPAELVRTPSLIFRGVQALPLRLTPR